MEPAESLKTIIQTSHTAPILTVDISPDNKYLASASSHDSAVKLWDIQSGVLIRNFPGHSGWVKSLAFSPDGKYLLTGAWDWSWRLWNIETGICEKKHGSTLVQSVCFVSDTQFLVAGGHNNETAKIALWNIDGEKPVFEFNDHTDAVMSVAATKDGKYFASGSIDKTVRVWSLAEKKEIRKIEHEYCVHAVDLLTTGNSVLLAVGTAKEFFTHGKADPRVPHDVLIYDILQSSDSPVKVLNGCEENIYSVAFSDDGNYVAAGGQEKSVRIWDLGNDQKLPFFTEPLDWPWPAVHSVRFSPNSKYLAGGGENKLPTLWNIKSREIDQTFQGHASSVFCAEMSSGHGEIIEVGEEDTINIWDLKKGEFVQALSTTQDSYLPPVNTLDISPDGKFFATGSGNTRVIIWNRETREEYHSFYARGGVTSVRFSEDGKYLATGSIGDQKGYVSCFEMQTKSLRQLETENSAIWGCHVGIHAGKGWIMIGYDTNDEGYRKNDTPGEDGRKKSIYAIWDFRNDDIYYLSGEQLNIQTRIRDISISKDGNLMAVATHDGRAPLFRIGKDMKPENIQFFEHMGWITSIDIGHGNQYILTGGRDNRVRVWDIGSGKLHSTLEDHEAEVSGRFSPDGRFLISASLDSSTKIWKLNDDSSAFELEATLVSIGETDWAVLTPNGLFDASPGAMRRMHYVSSLEVIELDQLKERYYEPGLLAKIIGGDGDDIRKVKTLRQVPLFPQLKKFRINSGSNQLEVEITVRDGGIGNISFFINNKEVLEDINPGKSTSISLDLDQYKDYFLPGKDANKIGIRLYNQDGWLKSPAHELKYTAPVASARGFEVDEDDDSEKKVLPDPTLFAIIIGTSQFKSEELNLAYPDHDASSLAKALDAVGSKLFSSKINIQLLTTNPELSKVISSKESIKTAFANVARKAGPQDIVFAYFSGHGVNYGSGEKGQFYYLTKDLKSQNLSDPETRQKSAISTEELTTMLNKIPARKQVLVFDTCHSGKVIEGLTSGKKALDSTQERALERMKDRTGMFVLAGSAADKVSFEATRYGQGLLTYSMLMGMKGEALSQKTTTKPTIDVMTLFQFSRDRVPRLAEEIAKVQEPVIAAPYDSSSFDIGISDDDARAKIPIKIAKPILIRSVFLDSETFRDHLEIGEHLDNKFMETSMRKIPKNSKESSPIIFVKVDKFPNAWAVSGLYTKQKNGDYLVRAKLYQGSELHTELKAAGKTGEAIAREMEKLVITSIKSKKK